MRFTRQLAALSLLSTAALIACGDDETGTGGRSTTTTTTGSTTTGDTTTTTSTTSTGMETGGGGEGGAPLAADAEPCADDDECDGGLCLGEDEFGFAGGYCSGLCSEAFGIACAAGSACVAAGDGALCLKECAGPGDCTGPGQTCVDWNGDGSLLVCLGGCSEDSQCQVACDNDSLLCGAAEVCDSDMDEDSDTLQDCEELDCAEDATCSAAITGACGGAIDVSAGGTFTGSTAGGTNLFGRVCASFFGNYPAGTDSNERVFAYTATSAGIVTVETSATTGDFDFYVRSSCDDVTTNVGGCFIAGDDAQFNVAVGDTLFFYVDGYQGDADYALDVSFLPQVCGDNNVVGSETCDDGNTMAGDGCDAMCQVEVDFFCNAATTITAGATNGDTSTGSNALISSCGGDGLEVIYEYTATATGDLDLVLSSASDQGIHVRTDCQDFNSEEGCADLNFGGTDETLTIPVTNGTTYTITVDAYTPGDEGPFTLTLTQN